VLDYRMQIFTHNESSGWLKVAQLDAERQKVVAIECWQNRLFFMTGNSILIFDYDPHAARLQFTSELLVNHEKFSLQFDYFRSIFALNFDRVFISDASGACIVVDVSVEKLMSAFKIPKSSEPWSTAVAQIDQFWLIADRMGSLFLYYNSSDASELFMNPIQKLSKLHSQSVGIKTIRILKDGFIQTTGNDGTIKTLFLDREKGKRSMKGIMKIFNVLCERNIY
jgi:hypothetical protein